MPAEAIAAYLRAKDENRPYLMERAFVPDATLAMVGKNRSDAGRMRRAIQHDRVRQAPPEERSMKRAKLPEARDRTGSLRLRNEDGGEQVLGP